MSGHDNKHVLDQSPEAKTEPHSPESGKPSRKKGLSRTFNSTTYKESLDSLKASFKELANNITNSITMKTQRKSNPSKLPSDLEFLPKKNDDFYLHPFTTLFSSGSKTGGVTGSLCITNKDNNKFQLKPTFSKQGSVVRKLKANCDAENLGEFIAALFAKAFFGEESNRVPNVYLLYDSNAKEIGIASEYIEKTTSNLNNFLRGQEFLRTNKIVPDSIKHLSLTKEEISVPARGRISLKTLPVQNMLMNDLAEAITLSALLGDHDIHHGNMIVTGDETEDKHIARIDFGHAFNDLINTYEIFGGKQRYYDPILDFFNRNRIAGINKASKLHHCYPGLMISSQMVEALKNFSGKYNSITDKAERATDALNKLRMEMEQHGDIAGQNNLKNSMLALYQRTGGGAQLKEEPLVTLIPKVIQHLGETVKNNCKSAGKVADMMDLQLKIDEILTGTIEGKNSDDIKQELETLLANVFPHEDPKCTQRQWLKMPNEEKGHTGTLKSYIISRMKYVAQAEKEPRKLQENLDKIIKNAETLDEQLFKTNKLDNQTIKASPALSSSNNTLYNNLQNFLQNSTGIASLLQELDVYYKNHLLRKEEKSSILNLGISSTKKTEAAQMLIAYLKSAQENPNTDPNALKNLVSVYGKAFNNGRLQNIISKHINVKSKDIRNSTQNISTPKFF